MILFDRPPFCIKSPAKMKRGTAINGKESAPVTIERAIKLKGGVPSTKLITNRELIPKLIAIGTPKISKAPSAQNKIIPDILNLYW
ncbi:hypothetical protein VSU01S_13310 [Vibrio superstes NBRC 103154]|uniref:Uncharacterized protein n=1 Tax=Vibrio superstes NBRC 103154 TaxID=1219062 RepID=A0A511QQA9_9VIBR|nr:hypothetical protein VSU01S_13310 [Vibrio superstes NBRC 103154]